MTSSSCPGTRWWRPMASTALRAPSAIPAKGDPAGAARCSGAGSPTSSRCSTAARWSGPVPATRSSWATRSPTFPTAGRRSTSSPNCVDRSRDSAATRTGTGPVTLADFLPEFEAWRFDWLDVPALIRSAPGTLLFPMVDRDPVARWTFGRSTLLGDAAHPMYPIGSNGASQAILDARVLAGCLRANPDVVAALERYESIRLPGDGGDRGSQPGARSRGTHAAGARASSRGIRRHHRGDHAEPRSTR